MLSLILRWPGLDVPNHSSGLNTRGTSAPVSRRRLFWPGSVAGPACSLDAAACRRFLPAVPVCSPAAEASSVPAAAGASSSGCWELRRWRFAAGWGAECASIFSFASSAPFADALPTLVRDGVVCKADLAACPLCFAAAPVLLPGRGLLSAATSAGEPAWRGSDWCITALPPRLTGVCTLTLLGAEAVAAPRVRCPPALPSSAG